MSLGLRRCFFAAPLVVFAGAAAVGCGSSTIGSTTGTGSSALGCPEFDGRTSFDGSTDIDVDVRAFMEASATIKQFGVKLHGTVLTACANIARDLGANDSWSAKGDSDDAVSNGNHDGACDAAIDRIEAIMNANANAGFALEVSEGRCTEDFDAEAQCETGCSTQTQCDPGKVETRCDPGQLSVVCDETCKAQATCEGSASVAANCQGKCDARCDGACAGTCIFDDGHRSDNDANCHGKCTASCTGTCTGHCVIDAQAGVSCGASVSCKGGCNGTYTQPKCETDFTPPTCTVDTHCFESCRAKAAASVTCDPPSVKLVAVAGVSGDVDKLVATLNANLPAVFAAAEGAGKIGADEVVNLVNSGKAVLDGAGKLTAHSLACATAAADAAGKASATFDVSVSASARIGTSCRSHAQ